MASSAPTSKDICCVDDPSFEHELSDLEVDFILIDGGVATLFWGFIAVFLGMVLVYASLAEMASMSPTAGGQYHWVSEFAPPKHQKILSYLVGWISAIGWQGLIALNDKDYVFKPWHATLLTIGIIAFAIIFNTQFAAKLPQIEGFVLILYIAGWFAIIIPQWVMAPRPPAEVLLKFSNNGGWSTVGQSVMIGLSQVVVCCLIGFDCIVHMSEETRDASTTIPKALMWSVGGNGFLAFGMVITLIFTMGDTESLLATSTRQPFIQLFYNTTQSYAATNSMTAIVAVMLCACSVSEVATASRQFRAFARDNGLPGSQFFSEVSTGSNLPIRSVVVSLAMTSLLSLINLGSMTALNAINSLATVAILSSYEIGIGCIVWRRLYGSSLPHRRWTLGKYGLLINICALLFLTPIWFFTFWPLARPVTAATMNWSPVMFIGVIIFALMWYFVKARHVFTGPVVNVNRDR